MITFHQLDQSAVRRMLHAGGVNKKTLKKKHKIEKAMATIKVVTYISVYTYLRSLTKLNC